MIFNFTGAYKDADGMKIDGRRIMVDCERGRTIKGFRPKRLGGGKGESRRNKEIERSLQRSMER
jgi:U1 small nuclear ribonucleoprotein